MALGGLLSMKNFGRAVTLGTEGPAALGHGKRYLQQQKQGKKKIDGPHAPGGAPPMRKVSAAEGLRAKLAENKEAASQGSFSFAKKTMLNVDPAAVLTAMVVGAGGIGAGLAAKSVAKGVGGVHLRFKADRMFKELQNRYPQIKKEKRAREAFDIAVAYAPSLLRHPAAIGDFVRRQLEYPMSGHEFIKQLAELEATISKTESTGVPSRIGQSFEQSVGQTPAYMPR